jgi:hypothetical protein
MQDHPLLGAVLFLIGTTVVFVAYAALNADPASLVAGHILVFNGLLWFLLGYQKWQLQKRRALQPIRVRRLPHTRG